MPTPPPSAPATTGALGPPSSDDDGATGTVTTSVAVAPVQAAQIAVRGQAQSAANATTARVAIPATVQAGDALVLIASSTGKAVSLSLVLAPA